MFLVVPAGENWSNNGKAVHNLDQKAIIKLTFDVATSFSKSLI